VEPANAADKTLTWSSNAEAIATVNNDGEVTAVAVGSATITATANNGVQGACVVTVSTVEVTAVTLQPTLSLNNGGTFTLTATVEPDNATDKSVTWSSNAEAIATVNNDGEVTAVDVGSATITVTSNADATKKATCVVTVNPVAVTGVSLNKTTITLETGNKETLIAAVAPDNATDKSVTWSSNATNMATVDNNGEVTAVATGSATITVTTTDGSKTATCAVTVVTAIVPVTGVTLDATTADLKPGDTKTLVATVAPPNATDKTVTWSSSNNSVATVNNGVVTAVSVGSATITATSNADNSKTATCAITVSPPAATGIKINLEGTTGSAVELAYTDNSTENLTITNSAVNISISGKTIKSITIDGGSPILIGRKADSNINLKFNGTALAFRDADGNGAIPIGTYAEFQLVSTNLAGSYRLEADLDLMNENWASIGSPTVEAVKFTGTFDGAHHTLANLYVNGTGNTWGLFRYLNNATIKNLGIISGSLSTSGVIIGAFAGKIEGATTIIGCYNKASVTSGGNQAGGIVGWSIAGTDCNIIACYNAGAIQGNSYVSGIVGYHTGTLNITACYNTGSVTGNNNSYSKGICASNATVTACYNIGSVNAGAGKPICDTQTASYYLDGSGTGAGTKFSDTAWPSASENTEWGTGDGSGSGTYWKDLGGWNGGTPVYPTLFFE
jgi:uncharacterized protein YjdB